MSFLRPSLIAIAVFAFTLSAAAQTEPDKPPVTVGWGDGKTTIATPLAELSLTNRLQFRLADEDADGADATRSFEIPRARLKLEGWAWTEKLSFEVQLDWADKANVLKDANVNYEVSPEFQLTVGQFKAPFGRQELTSSTRQQFVDRSEISDEFAHGRDVGLQAWGLVADDRVQWQAGVFNGNGRNFDNPDGNLMYAARVQWQPFGDVKYSEGDFESKGKPLFAIAANYANNDRHGATVGNDVARELLGLDATFKHNGFSLTSEYYTRDNDPELGASSTSNGWFVQSGWFLVRNRFEVAARYGTLDPSDRLGGDDVTESGVAFSWYLRKHNLKLQTDLRNIDDDASGARREARVQLQVIF